jgi:hypothetical protein
VYFLGTITVEVSMPDENIYSVENPLSINLGPRNSISDLEPEDPRMIGDFDGSANTLWTLFGTEAKSHDDVRISTLKENMEGIVIFVRSYSFHAIMDFGHANV